MAISTGDCTDADFVDLLAAGRDEAVLVVERPSRIIRACNDAVARVLGWRPAELIGRSTEILHLDRAHYVEFGEILDCEIANGRPFHRRYDVRHRDGRAIATMYLVVPIIDRSGGVTGSVSIIRDVTGEEANRRLLDLVVNEIPVSVAVTRASDGTILLANRACREMFGLTGSERTSGRLAPDFYADPADRQRLVGLLLRDGAVGGFELQMRRADGGLFWASASMRLIRYGGEEAIFGTVTDVTAERAARESERKTRSLLESIVDNAPAHIYLKDLDSRYLLVNRSMRDRLKRFVADPIGQTSFTHYRPEDAAKFAAQDAEVMRTRSAIEGEIVAATLGEQPRAYRVTKFPVLDDDGDVVAIGGISIDVTAERDARENAQRTWRLLEGFLDNAPGHVFLKDAEDRYLVVNRQFREQVMPLLGDPVGQKTHDVYSAEDTAKTKAHDREVVRTRSAVTREMELTRPGAPRRPLRITKFPVFDPTGALWAIGVISLDIAAERAARDAADQTARNLQAIVDNAPAEIFLKDREGRFILANRSLRAERERLGIDPADRKAYQPAELMARLEEQDRRVREEAVVVTDEAAIQTASGQRIKRIIKFPVLDSDGVVTAVGGIGIDITAERAARDAEQAVRRQLQAIIDNAPLHIFLKDRDRNYILVNRSLREDRERSGLAPDDRGSYQRHSSEIAARLQVQDREVFERGVVVAEEVTTTLNGSGETRTLRVIKFPVFDECGAVVAVGGIALDLSEQRQLEERLRQAQKIEAVGQLTGGIAHDFNNLVAVILGNAEILKDDLAADPAKRRMAEMIEQAGTRAADLTDRLLAFARQQALHPSVIDCNDLLDGLMELMRRTIGEDCAIERVAAPDCRRLWADRAQLENCLINLVVNARDAMPRGGAIRIEIADVAAGGLASAPDLAPGAYVRITVSDTGAGMTPEVQARAFDPFFTTKDVGKGTGLGLSMVYGFVKQSGGQVAIDSRVGAGTSVTLYLPAIAGDAAAAAVRDAAAPVPSGSETVLVVEDEPLVRSFVADELRRLGYDVVEAESGKAALDALRSRRDVALLFTDIVMPGGMRGNELARAARRLVPSLRVLFTTGYANAFDGKMLPDDELIPLLKKPYQRAELASQVRRCLDMAG